MRAPFALFSRRLSPRLWQQDWGIKNDDWNEPNQKPYRPLRFLKGRGILTYQQVWAPQRRAISGQCLDVNGAPLPGVTVDLFGTVAKANLATTTSDALGYFYFFVPFYPPTDLASWFLIAYLSGSPDVAGTTINNLRMT